MLRNLLEGASEALPPAQGTKKLHSSLEKLLQAIHEGIELYDAPAAQEVGKLLHAVIRAIDTRKQELKDVSDFAALSPLLLSLLIESESALRPHGKAEDQEAHSHLTHEALTALLSIAQFLDQSGAVFHGAVGELLARVEASAVEAWHMLSDEVVRM